MAYVKHVHDVISFIYCVDDSVEVRLIAEKELPEFLAFESNGPALREPLETVDRVREAVEPCERPTGSIGANERI